MNLGQTMITMGMFVLLIMSVISANRMLVQNAETGLQTEALTESATIANDLFQEAQSKYFDYTVRLYDSTGNGNMSPSYFSIAGGASPSEWGPSSAEQSLVGSLPDNNSSGQFRSINAYDDVDDYNGYRRTISADTTTGIRIGGFQVTVRVMYVDPNLTPNPVTKDLIAVNYQTFMKRIEVDVEHPQYLPKITYKSVMAY